MHVEHPERVSLRLPGPAAARARLALAALSLALAAGGCGDPATTGAADDGAPSDATAPDADAPDAFDDTSLDDAGADATTTPDATTTADATTADATVPSDSAIGPDVSEPSPAMKLHVLDVGQGESLIVELPCGAMLIDTGGEVTPASGGSPGFDSDDAFEAQVKDFFASRPDLHKTFGVVVLTHPHIDHTHGVPRLLAMVQAGDVVIRNVVTNGDASGFDSGLDEQKQLQQFADADPSIERWYVLQRKTTSAGFTNAIIDPFPACAEGGGLDPVVTALWGRIDADSPLSNTWDPNDLANANNHSVVLRVALGQASMLLGGDLEEAGIAALMAQYQGTSLLDVDLYKVDHHGSYNGTTAAFVQAMTPKVAVISAGPYDRVGDYTAYAYGHPRWHAVSDLVGDSDSPGVSARRPTAVDAEVAMSYQDDHGVFASQHITKAVYSTGWEHHAVVVTLHADGSIELP
ncbi:MAG: hypothetical protein U1F43_31905 [Myxococcota bacterium]